MRDIISSICKCSRWNKTHLHLQMIQILTTGNSCYVEGMQIVLLNRTSSELLAKFHHSYCNPTMVLNLFDYILRTTLYLLFTSYSYKCPKKAALERVICTGISAYKWCSHNFLYSQWKQMLCVLWRFNVGAQWRLSLKWFVECPDEHYSTKFIVWLFH